MEHCGKKCLEKAHVVDHQVHWTVPALDCSFRSPVDVLAMGMKVAQTDCFRVGLKIIISSGSTWLEQVFRTLSGIPSHLTAFLPLIHFLFMHCCAQNSQIQQDASIG